MKYTGSCQPLQMEYNIQVGTDYSQRSILQKLGIKLSHRLCLIHMPDDYIANVFNGENPTFDTTLISTYNFIHFFTDDKKGLEEMFPVLKNHLEKTGSLWISWRKKGAGVSHLAESDIMASGLENGLVDVKVARYDDTWSALKFVYRTTDRK